MYFKEPSKDGKWLGWQSRERTPGKENSISKSMGIGMGKECPRITLPQPRAVDGFKSSILEFRLKFSFVCILTSKPEMKRRLNFASIKTVQQSCTRRARFCHQL